MNDLPATTGDGVLYGEVFLPGEEPTRQKRPFRRGPLGLKPARVAKDPLYLARVARLPCCVCEAFGEVQDTPTQVHHVICGRFGQRKTPDRMTIPLCAAHHLTGEGGKLAIHSGKEAWVAKYGNDYDFTAATQDRVGV